MCQKPKKPMSKNPTPIRLSWTAEDEREFLREFARVHSTYGWMEEEDNLTVLNQDMLEASND